MSVSVSQVTKSFKTPHGVVTALSDINFDIRDGEFVSAIGKSGSGKTTLLTLLGALDAPTQGMITVDGKNIARLSGSGQTDYRARKIGFVFQQYNLIPNLSAIENVCLAMEFANLGKDERKKRASELLNQVGIIGDLQNRPPLRLSGGQQQRVSIARALSNEPSLILADEPTGNLDNETGQAIFDLLHELSRKKDTTIIVVTHDLDIAGRTDRKIEISDGKIVAGDGKKS